jgi:macrolide-specific efflux system membrane fusion protein
LQLQVPFSESDAAKVRLGQAATVSVNALPSTKLAGHVVSVSPTATVSSGVVSYNAVIELDQLEAGLKPGMTASAQVVVSQVDDAIGIPSAALSRAGGAQAVTVVRGGKHVSQPVVTGLQGDSSIQIVSGLNAGDQIVIPTVTGLGSGGAAAGGFGGRLVLTRRALR